jgi:hypothetical protein
LRHHPNHTITKGYYDIIQGSKMPSARVWINEIEFNSDKKICFDKNDIIVFVGPNNQGKSASLKELAKLLEIKNRKGLVLKGITIKKEGMIMTYLLSLN